MSQQIVHIAPLPPQNPSFVEVVNLIHQARQQAYHAANNILIDLYWQIGKYISERTAAEGWGKSTVQQLADYIARTEPNMRGFSDKNLWRMKQFYETYQGNEKLSTLSREIGWSSNMLIFSRCKSAEEQEFYLQHTIAEHYSYRDLQRQIDASYYERSMLARSRNEKLSPLLRVLPEKATNIFKESYVVEFLQLDEPYNERNMQKQLIQQMKQFVLELGRDFIFMGEEYPLQVGNKDFFVDMLFYHRELQCLVAFELKTTDFHPEHLGQLNFYLEALDRDVRKPHENPSIGVLLCKGKDEEVVEYALSRTLSPTLVSQYELALPDKHLLQQKLHELTENTDMRKE